MDNVKEAPEVAISDRIKDEARRTIVGIQKFYEKYGDDIDDAEELDHRIKRVEASMEGCNGLSQEDKIQKTAENLFELTCAQERSYDALRAEMKRTREESLSEFKTLREDLKKGLGDVMQKIEDSGSDCSASMASKRNRFFLCKLIANNPTLSAVVFLFVLILVFISGHFEVLDKFLSK